MMSSLKTVSASKHLRLLEAIRVSCRVVFEKQKRGKFYTRERAAALTYKEYRKISYRALEDELKSSAFRKLLGIRKPISKSALQRSARMLNRKQRRALLKSTLVVFYEGSLLVDSTGESTGCYDQWQKDKFTKAKQFRKAHVGVGAKSRQFLAFRVTRGTRHDSKEFKHLHEQAKQNALFNTVKGDGGYASRRNAQLVEDAGQTPFLKPAKNVTSRAKRCPAWKRMVQSYHHHAIEWMEIYHERSQVESVFSAFKRLFGAFTRAKRWVTQRVELELRAVAYNLYAAIHYQR